MGDISTLYNVCAGQRENIMMHVGDIMMHGGGDTISTSGIFSKSSGYDDACGEYHEYNRK